MIVIESNSGVKVFEDYDNLIPIGIRQHPLPADIVVIGDTAYVFEMLQIDLSTHHPIWWVHEMSINEDPGFLKLEFATKIEAKTSNRSLLGQADSSLSVYIMPGSVDLVSPLVPGSSRWIGT